MSANGRLQPSRFPQNRHLNGRYREEQSLNLGAKKGSGLFVFFEQKNLYMDSTKDFLQALDWYVEHLTLPGAYFRRNPAADARHWARYDLPTFF